MSEHALVGRNVFLLFKLEKFRKEVASLMSDPDKHNWDEITKTCKEVEKYILQHYKELEKEEAEGKLDIKFVKGEWKVIRGKKK